MHYDGGTSDVMRPSSLFRTALLALSLLYSPAALAGEDAPYPVWGSPELGFESLDDIDVEFYRRFPRGQIFHLEKHEMKGTKRDPSLPKGAARVFGPYGFQRLIAQPSLQRFRGRHA